MDINNLEELNAKFPFDVCRRYVESMVGIGLKLKMEVVRSSQRVYVQISSPNIVEFAGILKRGMVKLELVSSGGSITDTDGKVIVRIPLKFQWEDALGGRNGLALGFLVYDFNDDDWTVFMEESR